MSTNELVHELKHLLKIHDNKSIIYIPDIQNALNLVIDILQSHSNSDTLLKYGVQSSITNHTTAANATKINYDIDKDGGLNIDLISMPDIDCLIVSNFLGHIVDIEKYETWANYCFKYLIFDNRLTPYTFYNNKNSCNYGNVSIINFPFHNDGYIIIDKCIVDNDDLNLYPYTDMFLYKTILDNNNYTEYNYFWQQVELYNIPILKYPCFSDTDNHKYVSYIVFFSSISDILFESFIENNIHVEKYYKSSQHNNIDTFFYNNIICLPCFGINLLTIQLYIGILMEYIDILKHTA